MEVELMGHKAKVATIRALVKLPPFHPEESLAVWLELAEAVDGPIGFGIMIPIKDYTAVELQEVIHEVGSFRLAEIMREDAVAEKKRAAQKEREKALEPIVAKLSKYL